MMEKNHWIWTIILSPILFFGCLLTITAFLPVLSFCKRAIHMLNAFCWSIQQFKSGQFYTKQINLKLLNTKKFWQKTRKFNILLQKIPWDSTKIIKNWKVKIYLHSEAWWRRKFLHSSFTFVDVEDHCRATHFLNLTANFYETVSEGFVKCKTPNQLCRTIFFLEKYSFSRFKKYNKSYEYDLLINLSIGKIFGKNPQVFGL